MKRNMLKSKIHRATITEADLSYEGSITIDRTLCDTSQIYQYEKVDIYNCSNGERFSTYVMYGQPGEICLNGAAARRVQKDDIIIIASYVQLEDHLCAEYKPIKVFVDEENKIKEIG